MPCPGCLGQGHDAARCEECDGWGARLCERGCVAGRIVCADCSGTGRVYKVFVESNTKAGSNKCTTCSGRGYAKCDACQATGFLDCPVQEPGRDCAQCQGTGKVTCAAGV